MVLVVGGGLNLEQIVAGHARWQRQRPLHAAPPAAPRRRRQQQLMPGPPACPTRRHRGANVASSHVDGPS